MSVRVLIVEDEPYMSEAIRDGLRLEAIAADIAVDGDTALELLSINDYDIAVLDRDIGVRAGARRLPHEALRAPGARAPSQSPRPPGRSQPATRARDRRPSCGSFPPRGLPRRPLRRAPPESSSPYSKSSSAPKAVSSVAKRYWRGRGTRTQTRSPTPPASRSRNCANASAIPRSSPLCQASSTA
jgi:hypothetical protein